MVKSKWRGNPIEYINDIWVYSDTRQPVPENKNRECGNCGKEQTLEGHDGCLGTLDGVMNACCGHGVANEAYIIFDNSKELRGYDAIKWIQKGEE
jgi:hypothetical protein